MDYGDKEDKLFLYDLRQRRAKIIGDCIDEVVYSFKEENFYVIFKNIQDLYSVCSHAFADEEKVGINFLEKQNKVIDTANKYAQTWLGKHKQPNEAFEIETALRDLFTYIMQEIEGAGLFGTSWDEDSDV